MRCHTCGNQMLLTDSVTEGGASQTWHECPVCARTETVTRPTPVRLRRVGDRQRCGCGQPTLADLARRGPA